MEKFTDHIYFDLLRDVPNRPLEIIPQLLYIIRHSRIPRQLIKELITAIKDLILIDIESCLVSFWVDILVEKFDFEFLNEYFETMILLEGKLVDLARIAEMYPIFCFKYLKEVKSLPGTAEVCNKLEMFYMENLSTI